MKTISLTLTNLLKALLKTKSANTQAVAPTEAADPAAECRRRANVCPPCPITTSLITFRLGTIQHSGKLCA